MDDKARILIAEAFGTMFLVIGGCGTAILATGGFLGGDSPSVGILGVATAFGLSLLVMAYTIGHISGCHVNPAVTLGLVVTKRVDAALLSYYWIGQLLGGLVGGFVLWLALKLSDLPISEGFASNGYGDHSPSGFELGSVALVEIVMTGLLVFVVATTTRKQFPAGFGGLAAGFTLWLIHLISIPVSNTSVNPARSLGVAPFADANWPMEQLWAFIVFPSIGALFGAALYRACNRPEGEGTRIAAVDAEEQAA
jgi:aquaporin Z